MNKETRQFIWGLTLTFICGFGAAIHIYNLIDGMLYTSFNWGLFIMCIIGFINGIYYIAKTT